jgi:hypothetical protein
LFKGKIKLPLQKLWNMRAAKITAHDLSDQKTDDEPSEAIVMSVLLTVLPFKKIYDENGGGSEMWC